MMTLRVLFAAGLVGVLLCEAQTPTPEKFDVASVKVNPNSRIGCTQDARGCAIPPTWGGTTFTATNVSLDLLVQLAYGVEPLQISGKEHLPSDRYDISA